MNIDKHLHADIKLYVIAMQHTHNTMNIHVKKILPKIKFRTVLLTLLFTFPAESIMSYDLEIVNPIFMSC